jgi:hypothetical protein
VTGSGRGVAPRSAPARGGSGGAAGTGGAGGGAAGLRSPRNWLTLSTGSQSSKPSLQQNSSASRGCPAIQRCAAASENGPDCAPSRETYHSGSSAGGLAIADANAAPSAPPDAGASAWTSGAAVVDLWARREPAGAAAAAAGGSTSSGLGMPSRTVITFPQLLQRIFRILPRTRSSPIE